MSKSKALAGNRASRQAPAQHSAPLNFATPGPASATRETVESIAVAVILAFLFRAFVAEAFVIPTGSMAPTLMGQHKDVQCPECGYWYEAGASVENEDDSNPQRQMELRESEKPPLVVATTCPLCRYRQVLDLDDNANHSSFSGDRILVSKFEYDFTSPERWDVIVFKFPGNAKQNFIKRLIGLPEETIRIKHGDIFVRQPDESEFQIARKPDTKLEAMLQLVADTKHIAKDLIEVGWPIPWQAWSADGGDVSGVWTTGDYGRSFDTAGKPGEDVWLRYHHIVPDEEQWQWIRRGNEPPMMDQMHGELITDYYAYNAYTTMSRVNMRSSYSPSMDPYSPKLFGSASLGPFGTLGLHWVSDLAMEGEVAVDSDEGELLLQLVKGGVSYACRIDVGTGRVTLSIDHGQGQFVGEDGATVASPSGQSALRGKGSYKLRMSNVDGEIRLWVNERRVEFDGPTTYLPRDDARPVTSAQDPGDLAPVGIGTQGVALHVHRLRVLRDIYYIANEDRGDFHEYPHYYSKERIWQVLQDPSTWATTELFDARGDLEYPLKADQFFPLGDNSPQSSDARLWYEHFFSRDLLIGKALLIYWPHPWYRPIPYMPNLKRMRLIH